MYYYIIDPQKLDQKAYERVQNRLYSSLSESRISGETVRVTGLRTIPQLVDIAFSHGAKTLVAVGNDDTLHEIINATKNRDIIIGFIPLYETELANVLGIADIESACRIVAGRRIAQLDMGVANQNYFLSKLTFGLNPEESLGSIFNFGQLSRLTNLPTFEVKFSADESYQGMLKVVGGMIVNTRGKSEGLGNPMDEILDVILLPKLNRLEAFRQRKKISQGLFERIPGSGLLHLKKIIIQSPDGLPLRVGNRIVAKSPATVEVAPKALKMIVGKDRTF